MLIYWIVLLEGFVTISYEILSIRQLIPIVGNSVVVTSLIIGVFLLFLAYGYRKGGLYQQEYAGILRRNFLIAAIGMGVGLSYLFIQFFFHYFNSFFNHSSLIVLALYLLLFVAPVVYLLGQTVPITLNMWKQDLSSVGRIGGQVLHISTIGSFLGATLTALLLLNYFGVAWSIFFNIVILIGLTLLLIDSRKQNLFYVISLVVLGFVFWLNVSFEKNYFITTNNYANYQVKPDPEEHSKILIINNSYSSAIDNNKKGFEYIEFIKRVLFENLHLTNKDILVLGAGGFTLSAEKTQNNRFLYVDIDDRIPQIVSKHFFRPNGEFIADDARHFVNTTEQKFDVVVSDTYSNGQSITPHLLTIEYFSGIKKIIKEGGYAIFNIIARPTLEDSYSKRIDTTLRMAFGSCVSIPMTYSFQPTNLIYICKNAANSEDKVKYTDDRNNATLDFFEGQIEVG